MTAFRVAVVGSGPAGFYAADALLKASAVEAQVDLLERLPMPYGLVRYGVAPDHQKIKSVTRAFDKIAAHPRFRLLGNVEVGRDAPIEALREHYHAVICCTGSAADRRLDIPGEDLPGSHAATDFVAWYNGHPDARAFAFDLSSARAVVVGVGNVAMDVARVLVRSPDELAATDLALPALAALRGSAVREVWVLGRRGAEHAAFDQSELADIDELPGVTVDVDLAQAEAGLAALGPDTDGATRRKLEHLVELGRRGPQPAERRVVLRFYRSPLAFEAGAGGRVGTLVVGLNRAGRDASGRVTAEATGERERLTTGAVFRSIGYRGQPLPGLPFDARSGTLPHREGRVVDPGAGGDATVLRGVYAAGWIKRGPSGVIGTNKSDAQATVQAVLEDAPALLADRPSLAGGAALDALLAAKGVRVVSAADWQRLDAVERERGAAHGAVREKLVDVAEALALLG